MNNNIKKMICIFILGLFFIPSTVYGMTQQKTPVLLQDQALDSSRILYNPGDESMPKDGVTYFVTYPNGYEMVKENYSDALKANEVIIFEGNTNENGEVIIPEVYNSGQFRIIEDVPNGYTTNQSEIHLDLDKGSVAQFVNNRGFVNPQTGTSILLIVILAALAGIVYFYLNGKIKKARGVELLLLLIVMGSMSYSLINVKADELNEQNKLAGMRSILNRNEELFKKDLVITVNDNHGQKMNNVRIKVYAKPISIEASPAIKFSATGGSFFDGNDTMYFRIPYEGCLSDEFYKSLSDSEYNYLNENVNHATKPGYKLGYDLTTVPAASIMVKRVAESQITNNELQKRDFLTKFREYLSNEPDKFYNGNVINLNWRENPESQVVTYHLNGGTLDFYGKKLTSFKHDLYMHDDFIDGEVFLNYVDGANYIVGISIDPQCSEYAPYGLSDEKEEAFIKRRVDASDYYVCWNEKPDGIYVNDVLFIGNDSTCFNESHYDFKYDRKAFQLYKYNDRRDAKIPAKTFIFSDIIYDKIGLSYLYNDGLNFLDSLASYDVTQGNENEPMTTKDVQRKEIQADQALPAVKQIDSIKIINLEKSVAYRPRSREEIKTLKIVYHGKEILSITNNDLNCDDVEKEGLCTIKDNKVTEELRNYFENISSNCMKKAPEREAKKAYDIVRKDAKEVA